MKERKSDFNILESIERHIGDLKPLVPKQAIVCVGEYPIKTLLKHSSADRDGLLPIFVEKSSDDIYKWLPKGYKPHLVLGFEDNRVDTHFYYDVLPALIRDRSVIDSIKKRSAEKLRGAVIFSSVWDGVGSAAVPSLTEKFKREGIDSLSIAILPSKIQPADAHLNAYAMMQLALQTDGSTVLLLNRDQLEAYEGVNRKGEQLKGNSVVNYLLELFLSKELLVQEISELSRTFNIRIFSALAVTAASYKVYGSIGNMLDTALLKPLSYFDISSASLLYVLLRMPAALKDTVPRAKIDLAITNWFKNKTNPQSIHISEPIYTQDLTDRIDAVLFIGGFDTAKMFGELEDKVSVLKANALEKGLMTQDWQLPYEVEEEPPKPEEPQTLEKLPIPQEQPIAQPPAPEPIPPPPAELPVPAIEESQTVQTPTETPPEAELISVKQPLEPAVATAESIPAVADETVSEKTDKPKRRRTKKAEPTQQPEETKPKKARRTKKPQTEQKAE
jgi:hypothetical protein